jgi:thiamine-phosphate pyrophosphorylase
MSRRRSPVSTHHSEEPRGRRPPGPPPVRLYLITRPLLDDPGTLIAELEAMIGGEEVAALLVRPGAAGEHLLRRSIETVASIVHPKGIAVLTDGRPEVAAQTAADGTHCCGVDALVSALGVLKPERIAGAGCIGTRHDAMVAGEAGADYVLFGEPDATGRRPSFEAVVERVSWWAETFEVPCVGYAATLDEAAALARAGADFIAADDMVWGAAGGPSAGLQAIVARLHAGGGAG